MQEYYLSVKQAALNFISVLKLDEISQFPTAAYCEFIAILAFIVAVCFVFRVSGICRKARRLQRTRPSEEKVDELVKGDELIYRLDVFFEKEKHWGMYWRFYKQQLLQKKNIKTGEDEWVSCRFASEFFNEFTLVETKINLPFFRAIPSVLTGLGILGTFIGLTFSLTAITGEIDQTDLTRLLSGAGFAFMTSIAGLSCSLVLTWINKLALQSLQKSCESVSSYFDKAFPVISTEQEMFIQSALMERIEAGLSGRNKEIAAEIEKQISKFTNRLGDRLSEEIENMGKAFGSVVSDSAIHLEKAAKDLNECTQVMKTQTIENVKMMESCLKEASTKIVETNKAILEQTSESLACSVEKIANDLESHAQHFIDGIQDALNKTQTTNAQVVSETMDKLQKSASAIETSGKQFSSELDRFNQNFKDTVDQITAENGQIVTNLKKLNTTYLKTNDKLFTENQKAIQQTTDTTVQLLDQLLERHRLCIDAVDLKNKSSLALLDQISNGMTAVIDEMKLVVKGQKTLQQTEAQRQADFVQTMQLIEKQCQGFEGLNELLKSYRSMAEAYEKIEHSMGKIAETTDGMSDRYLRLHNELQESASSARGQLNASIREMDFHMANIVKLLNTTVQSWNETQSANAEKLLDAVKQKTLR